MSMSELQALNPSAATLEVHCHPSLIPEHVKRFAVQRGSRHIVTDELQDELRSYAPLASVFIEVNPAAPTENAQVMASEYGLSCPNMVDHDELHEPTWANAHYLAALAVPAQPAVGSRATSLPRIAVCAHPPGITGNEWYGGLGIKGTNITNAAEHAKQTAKATVIFYLDANAPPESIWNFGPDIKVRCPGKLPIPYDKWVALNTGTTGTGSQASGSTNAGTPASPTATATSTTPKTGSAPPSSTSSPNGKGPPLSTFETIARNLAIAGALAQMDTSGQLKDPLGNRSGIPGGKNVGGFSFPLLQAGVSTLQILTSVGMSPKSFIDDIIKIGKKGQRAIIKEADAKVMQVADDLIKNHGQFEMAKGLQEMQTIMPYALGEKFTAKLGGKFQAHKIFERQAIKEFMVAKKGLSEEAIEKAVDEVAKKYPSIILSDAEHKVINANLAAAWTAQKAKLKPGVKLSKADLREIYTAVYKADHPHWLDAIESYLR